MATTDVLDVVRSFRPAEASESNIYAGDGTAVGRWRRSRQDNPQYKANLLEAAGLYQQVCAGSRRAALEFQEAMSTSDFAILFADIIDRQLLAKYQQTPVMWSSIARRGRVRDFRTVKRFTLDGGEATLDEVKQLAPYKAAALTDGKYEYSVKKYGRRIPLSWETLINDDLDAFQDIPTRLANAARRSEERFFTDLFTNAAGPDTGFFTAGNANIVTGNPALSVAGLTAAFTVLNQQVDTDGAPIYINGVILMVPPALEVTANNIVNATLLDAATGGGAGTGSDQLRVANWLSNRVRVVVNPWLPIITTSNENSWYLFADPDVGRPAAEVGFLIGHESPEMFQKSPNATRVGGGLVAPEEGDFDTDAVEWKVRHVFGGVVMDPKSAVASTVT